METRSILLPLFVSILVAIAITYLAITYLPINGPTPIKTINIASTIENVRKDIFNIVSPDDFSFLSSIGNTNATTMAIITLRIAVASDICEKKPASWFIRCGRKEK